MPVFRPLLSALVVFMFPPLLAACRAGPTEPTTIVNPALREIRIDSAALRPFGALVIYAVPADPNFKIRAHDRIPVSVRTSAGDVETVMLKSRYCRTADGAEYACDVFYAGLQGGDHAEQLQPYLDEIPARYTWIPSDRRAAAIQILGGSLEDAMGRAQTWPDVRWVERSGFSYIQGGPPRAAASALGGAIAFDVAGAALGDGHVQARLGEEIVIEYRQPDGTILNHAKVF